MYRNQVCFTDNWCTLLSFVYFDVCVNAWCRRVKLLEHMPNHTCILIPNKYSNKTSVFTLFLMFVRLWYLLCKDSTIRKMWKVNFGLIALACLGYGLWQFICLHVTICLNFKTALGVSYPLQILYTFTHWPFKCYWSLTLATRPYHL